MSQRPLHAIVTIGGGTSGSTFGRLFQKHVSEHCEWRNTRGAAEKLVRATPSHSHLHLAAFGAPRSPEHMTITMKTFAGTSHRIQRKWFDWRNKRSCGYADYFEVPTSRAVPGLVPATQTEVTKLLDQAVRALINKRSHPEDRLTIVLEGHGSPHGVQLWNDWLSLHFVSPRQVQDVIERVPKSIPVTVLVNACYSGQFLQLTDARTTVFTSSDALHPSIYSPMGKSWIADVRWLTPDQRTMFDVLANDRSGNFRASHSLDWWLEKELEALSGRGTVRRALSAGYMRWTVLKHRPSLMYAGEAGFFALIILDGSGCLLGFAQLKMAIAVVKIAIPFVSLGVHRFRDRWIHQLERRSPAFATWRRQRYVARDRRLVAEVQQRYQVKYQKPDELLAARERAFEPESVGDLTHIKVLTFVEAIDTALPEEERLAKLAEMDQIGKNVFHA